MTRFGVWVGGEVQSGGPWQEGVFLRPGDRIDDAGAPWVARIRAAPDDDDVRRVSADHLEQTGHRDLAAWLQAEVERHRIPGVDLYRLARRVGRQLRADLARSLPIEGCGVDDCPRVWTALRQGYPRNPHPLEPLHRGPTPCLRTCARCDQLVRFSDAYRCYDSRIVQAPGAVYIPEAEDDGPSEPWWKFW